MSDANDIWAAWQRDHAAALAALQTAQRAYHRDAAERAVNGRRSTVGVGESALGTLNAARANLDDVRARMPR